MKIIKKSLLLIAFMLGASAVPFTIAQADVTPEYYSTPGIACQPANLGQAQNFDATWNNLGVFNPNPIGSGRSFFVICPVTFGDGQTNRNTNAADIYVVVYHSAGSADVRCTANRFDVASFSANTNPTGLIKSVSVISSGLAGNPVVNAKTISNVIDHGADTLDGLRDFVNVLCDLQPGTAIRSVAFDYD